MNKRDCKIGMYVSVIHNISALPRGRTKINRIGKIVGIYDNYVTLLLFDSDFSDFKNILIKRKLYVESFRFNTIFEMDQDSIKQVKEE